MAQAIVQEDTIAAIATAVGEASVAIVRVSGKGARAVGEGLVRSKRGRPVKLEARGMRYGQVVDPKTGEVIDEAIILWMPGPHSYTGEDVLELQVHGGSYAVEAVLAACLDAGARLAEPGEFTKRAFLNGRMDLSQAEAVIDLIRAKTSFAGKLAERQVRGRFGDAVRALRRRLIELEAHVEVTIDYPEHDVEDVACDHVVRVCDDMMQDVDRLIRSAELGRVLRDGIATAIVGRPNVGKSSLLNALLERDRAIVTDLPGTTRDVLEEYINLRGIPLRLIDTAGIRETDDVVERIGVARSRASMQDAELVLWVVDASEPPTPEDEVIARESAQARRIVVLNKVDRGLHPEALRLVDEMAPGRIVRVSAREGTGLDALRDAMVQTIQRDLAVDLDVSYMANQRQRRLLEEAKDDLRTARDAAAAGATLDLVAVALQSAYEKLGETIGEEAGEDLLNEIFSRFCLGK
ncbi:tRNA uridine-5-carboxymethylaminomethyl(34) synthesis GTPase MnmE [Alicyclobacillus vulcanalis]|uniref:tRNA modification GTPase MnmE n=1 Tax=Alicyclobacillus vulcanalis TaxID=252246 RepID=A0A1N7LP90_9BACL|nr:tRNA uridine-5-carboxymethylaminomethyl(34) synthesis GTPase MnmE [Alicyclobacillus vulcanalis]SIS75574.1 tRNA modification GTPase [Alicyclobacillus vulcanalis]